MDNVNVCLALDGPTWSWGAVASEYNDMNLWKQLSRVPASRVPPQLSAEVDLHRDPPWRFSGQTEGFSNPLLLASDFQCKPV